MFWLNFHVKNTQAINKKHIINLFFHCYHPSGPQSFLIELIVNGDFAVVLKRFALVGPHPVNIFSHTKMRRAVLGQENIERTTPVGSTSSWRTLRQCSATLSLKDSQGNLFFVSYIYNCFGFIGNFLLVLTWRLWFLFHSIVFLFEPIDSRLKMSLPNKVYTFNFKH